MAAAGAAARISKVFDQYSRFLSLEGGLFSLGQPSAYLQLNDPKAQDSDIEARALAVVSCGKAWPDGSASHRPRSMQGGLPAAGWPRGKGSAVHSRGLGIPRQPELSTRQWEPAQRRTALGGSQKLFSTAPWLSSVPWPRVQAVVAGVVEGLFCVLATLGVVPIIRCPKASTSLPPSLFTAPLPFPPLSLFCLSLCTAPLPFHLSLLYCSRAVQCWLGGTFWLLRVELGRRIPGAERTESRSSSWGAGGGSRAAASGGSELFIRAAPGSEASEHAEKPPSKLAWCRAGRRSTWRRSWTRGCGTR